MTQVLQVLPLRVYAAVGHYMISDQQIWEGVPPVRNKMAFVVLRCSCVFVSSAIVGVSTQHADGVLCHLPQQGEHRWRRGRHVPPHGVLQAAGGDSSSDGLLHQQGVV